MCGFAKTMADRRLIRVVFVTEGVAPKQLYQRNTWGMHDIEMRDIPLEPARSMLRDSVKEISDDLVDKVVCELTGGRVGFVRSARDALATPVKGRSEDDMFEEATHELRAAVGNGDPSLSTMEAYNIKIGRANVG